MEDIPKTELCCGLKPKRMFIQTSYRDDEGDYVLQCRKKCGNKISITNNYRGTSLVEKECVAKWNDMLTQREASKEG